MGGTQFKDLGDEAVYEKVPGQYTTAELAAMMIPHGQKSGETIGMLREDLPYVKWLMAHANTKNLKHPFYPYMNEFASRFYKLEKIDGKPVFCTLEGEATDIKCKREKKAAAKGKAGKDSAKGARDSASAPATSSSENGSTDIEFTLKVNVNVKK